MGPTGIGGMNDPNGFTETSRTGCIRLSDLAAILEDCARDGGIEFDEGSWYENQSSFDEILENHEDLKGQVFRLYGDRLGQPSYKDGQYYEAGALVVNRLNLLIDPADWTPFFRLRGLFAFGLYFEECKVEASGVGKEVLSLLFATRVFFRRTEFISGLRSGRVRVPPRPAGIGHVPSTWLVNLCPRGSISFERCSFGGDNIQLRCLGAREDADASESPPTHTRTALAHEDDVVDNSSDRGLTIKFPPETPSRFSMEGVAFYGNREIGTIDLVSTTEELILRAGNQVASLRLPGRDLPSLPSRISLGLSEAIDPKCRDPLRHRDMFTRIKRLAMAADDRSLLRASTAQIDRIDHFLIRQDRVNRRPGIASFMGPLAASYRSRLGIPGIRLQSFLGPLFRLACRLSSSVRLPRMCIHMAACRRDWDTGDRSSSSAQDSLFGSDNRGSLGTGDLERNLHFLKAITSHYWNTLFGSDWLVYFLSH